MTLVQWVDSLPLLKPVVLLSDRNGCVIEKTSKLSVLVAHNLPDLDVSKAHSADFDVMALYQLVLKQFDDNWEKAKEALLLHTKVAATPPPPLLLYSLFILLGVH